MQLMLFLRKLFKMQPLIDLLLETVSAQLIATLFRHKKTDFLRLISEPSYNGKHHALGGAQHSPMFHELLFKCCKGGASSVVLRNMLPSCPELDTSYPAGRLGLVGTFFKGLMSLGCMVLWPTVPIHWSNEQVRSQHCLSSVPSH